MGLVRRYALWKKPSRSVRVSDAAGAVGWYRRLGAHDADAPFIRAAAAGPAPDLTDLEQPIYEQIVSQIPAEPVIPPRIDRELADGDELSFGDGAVSVAAPGHTPGSVALYLPRHRVLFTGNAAARSPNGTVICGVFNVNLAQAATSLRRLATLDTTVACSGELAQQRRLARLGRAHSLPVHARDAAQGLRHLPDHRNQRQD